MGRAEDVWLAAPGNASLVTHVGGARVWVRRLYMSMATQGCVCGAGRAGYTRRRLRRLHGPEVKGEAQLGWGARDVCWGEQRSGSACDWASLGEGEACRVPRERAPGRGPKLRRSPGDAPARALPELQGAHG